MTNSLAGLDHKLHIVMNKVRPEKQAKNEQFGSNTLTIGCRWTNLEQYMTLLEHTAPYAGI